MKIRWTKRAILRLKDIHDYIALDSPRAASMVARLILESLKRLEMFPKSGRPGRIEGTRELVVPGLPYVLPYRVVDEEILIISVIHSKQKWPKQL